MDSQPPRHRPSRGTWALLAVFWLLAVVVEIAVAASLHSSVLRRGSHEPWLKAALLCADLVAAAALVAALVWGGRSKF